MRVLLDTSATRRGVGGTSVYVVRLKAALEEAGVDVLDAVDRARRPPGGGGIASLRNAGHDLRWRQRLAALARELRADVLHHPLPAHTWRAPCPQVVTVHDLAFVQAPALFAPSFRRWAGVEHRLAAGRADAVICVSRESRAQALRHWRLDPERALVAHHGPGQWDGAPGSPPRGDPTHFLYVGDAEPRKNLGLLLEGYRRYRAAAGSGALNLVVAGSGALGLEAATGDGVVVEVAPDAARLRELHAGAAALVHVAALEGFGLTALEAMHVGTPVLALRSAAVAEVCGPAARYLAGDDPHALAAALTGLAGDPSLRADLSNAGLRRAADFSWAAAARAHIEAYTLARSVSLQTRKRR